MADAGLTKSTDIDTTVREIDFVTRFNQSWDALREILGIMRPVKKESGTKLTAKKATVALRDGSVGEGEVIPASKAKVTEIDLGSISIKKYKKEVSIEAIDEKGYENAIQKTDDEFLNELQSVVMDDFYSYLVEYGAKKVTSTTFQKAVAMAKGNVVHKWKEMHKSTTAVIAFCNDLDAYEYLGDANITTQVQFGIEYLENFLGMERLILSADIPSGLVVATPAENIVNYYVDPSDSSFARAGMIYRTDGDTNLIGFHVQGDYDTAVSKSFALMGNRIIAEYVDGIVLSSFKPSVYVDRTKAAIQAGDTLQLTGTTTNTSETITWSSSDSEIASVTSGGLVSGVAAGTAVITASITDDGVTYSDSCEVQVIANP